MASSAGEDLLFRQLQALGGMLNFVPTAQIHFHPERGGTYLPKAPPSTVPAGGSPRLRTAHCGCGVNAGRCMGEGLFIRVLFALSPAIGGVGERGFYLRRRCLSSTPQSPHYPNMREDG